MHAIRSGVAPSSLRSARSWLFRISTNLAHDHHRRQRAATVSLADVASADDGFTDPTGRLIHQVLAALPFHEATTLLLHYESGFSRQEISEMEGVTEEAVKSRLRRGRAHFIRLYDQLQGGPKSEPDSKEHEEEKIRELLSRAVDGLEVPPPVFVPEVGFRPGSGGLRLARPVAVEQGRKRLTVHHLVSSQIGTELAFEVSGLAIERRPDARPQWMRDEVRLLDERGREYRPSPRAWMAGGESRPQGGSATVRRSMTLEPLESQVHRVELRINGYVGDWVVPIDLILFDTGLAGTKLTSSVSRHGITITLRNVSFGAEVTALDLEVVAEPPVRFVRGLGALHGMRRGPSRLVLRDDHGRLYEETDATQHRPQDPMGRVDVATFPPIPPDARALELEVPYVVVEEGVGTAEVELPVTEPRRLVIGDFQIQVLRSGRLVPPPKAASRVGWDGISLELDLGDWQGDRRLLMPGRVLVDGHDYGYRLGAMSPGIDEPAKHLEIPLSDPTTAGQVSLRYPTVQVRGPWTLRFPREVAT